MSLNQDTTSTRSVEECSSCLSRSGLLQQDGEREPDRGQDTPGEQEPYLEDATGGESDPYET